MRSDEFERLYAEHAEPLLAFLTYRTGSRTVAEDLVADTFERVLRARRPFDPRRASEKTWLYTIALNCWRDHGRRRASESRALARVSTSEAAQQPRDELSSAEDRHTVLAALAALSDEEREAVALRYGADLSLKDIARVTGQPRTTVEARVYRGLRRIREWVEEGPGEVEQRPGT